MTEILEYFFLLLNLFCTMSETAFKKSLHPGLQTGNEAID